jgi:hypothetical protein
MGGAQSSHYAPYDTPEAEAAGAAAAEREEHSDDFVIGEEKEAAADERGPCTVIIGAGFPARCVPLREGGGLTVVAARANAATVCERAGAVRMLVCCVCPRATGGIGATTRSAACSRPRVHRAGGSEMSVMQAGTLTTLEAGKCAGQ